MKKWYNVELSYNTKTMTERVNNFRAWLYNEGIKHETSSASDMVHFEIFLSENEVEKVNNALDEIVWF